MFIAILIENAQCCTAYNLSMWQPSVLHCYYVLAINYCHAMNQMLGFGEDLLKLLEIRYQATLADKVTLFFVQQYPNFSL